jgi:hypothetical protein
MVLLNFMDLSFTKIYMFLNKISDFRRKAAFSVFNFQKLEMPLFKGHLGRF